MPNGATRRRGEPWNTVERLAVAPSGKCLFGHDCGSPPLGTIRFQGLGDRSVPIRYQVLQAPSHGFCKVSFRSRSLGAIERADDAARTVLARRLDRVGPGARWTRLAECAGDVVLTHAGIDRGATEGLAQTVEGEARHGSCRRLLNQTRHQIATRV